MSPLLAPQIQNGAKEQRTISGQDDLQTTIYGFLVSRQVLNVAPGTLLFYTHKLKIFSMFCEANNIRFVADIDNNFVISFLIYAREGHNPGGVLAIYKTLRALFRWYEDETGHPTPMRRVKAPRVALPPLAPADKASIARVLTYCDDRDRAIILILLDTGVRAAELLAIEQKDVNLLAGSIVVVHGKGYKTRTVFMGKNTRKALRKWLSSLPVDPDARLFYLTYTGLRMMLKRRCKDAGIPYISPHQFRRTFALEMLRAGCDIYSLQLLMGHSDLQTLRRYLAQTTDDLRIAHGKASPGDKL